MVHSGAPLADAVHRFCETRRINGYAGQRRFDSLPTSQNASCSRNVCSSRCVGFNREKSYSSMKWYHFVFSASCPGA
jgi:hypothetical protein